MSNPGAYFVTRCVSEGRFRVSGARIGSHRGTFEAQETQKTELWKQLLPHPGEKLGGPSACFTSEGATEIRYRRDVL